LTGYQTSSIFLFNYVLFQEVNTLNLINFHAPDQNPIGRDPYVAISFDEVGFLYSFVSMFSVIAFILLLVES
jgi:hypothetical protein